MRKLAVVPAGVMVAGAILMFAQQQTQQPPASRPSFEVKTVPGQEQQQTPPATPQDPAAATEGGDFAKFIETVQNVVAPTTVLDRDGRIVNGLRVSDFILYDNEKPQRISADIVFQPISLVIVVQANASVDKMIPKIQKIGAAIDQTILGETGEAAVISFDHRVQTLQPFTSEKGKIDAAIRKISLYGSSQNRLNDAVNEGINMLKRRPKDRRRVILLISETRDGSSAARPREVMREIQFNDITVYTINISHWIAALTRTAPVPRPDPIPPEAHHAPGGGVMTPTMVSQNFQLGSAIPVFVEIFRAVKGIFIDNPSEVYTKFSGGREYTFMSQASLDKAVLDIGEEIHSQYLLSYRPQNVDGGFHTIRVEVVGQPHLKTRTRPGYWIAGPKEEAPKAK